MKSKTILAIFAMLVMSICSLTSYAQDESKSTQGYVVWEDVVYPSKISAYEKATKIQMKVYALHYNDQIKQIQLP